MLLLVLSTLRISPIFAIFMLCSKNIRLYNKRHCRGLYGFKSHFLLKWDNKKEKGAFQIEGRPLITLEICRENVGKIPGFHHRQKTKKPQTIEFTAFFQSKRQDLNLRPLRPERSALPN